MTSVVDFEGWLHHTACQFGDQNMHDDLVQEGRIAMWKQEVKHGGKHAGFMTSQARLRMGQISRGEKAFGGIKVPVREVKPSCSLEDFEFEIGPATADFADRAVLAYHHGEIYAAIDRLPPKQKEATRILLQDGAMSQAQRMSWVDARRKLAEELAHLKE